MFAQVVEDITPSRPSTASSRILIEDITPAAEESAPTKKPLIQDISSDKADDEKRTDSEHLLDNLDKLSKNINDKLKRAQDLSQAGQNANMMDLTKKLAETLEPPQKAHEVPYDDELEGLD